MTDREDLLIRAARACDQSRMANDYSEGVDEGLDLPRHAAARHWDAASSLAEIARRAEALASAHTLEAKRYERAQREEDRSGSEYREEPA